MNETELASMIVRLSGDASQYEKMLGDAEKSTKDTAKTVEDASKQIEGAEKSLNHFATAAANAVVALGGLSVLKEALAGFQEAEMGAVKLSAAIQASGQDVEATTKRFDTFIVDMERLTGAEDDATAALLQQATVMGLNAVQAERAAKNAISLAAARGMDAQSAIRLTAALEQGNSEMLMRTLPNLKNIEDETERATAAQEQLAGMFGTAEAAAKTSSGMMKKLSDDYGNMLEDIGAVVADAIRPFVGALTELVAVLKGLPGWVKTAAVAVIGLSVAFTVAAAAVATFKGGMALLVGAEAIKAVGTFGALKLAVVGFAKSLVTSPLTAWVAAGAAVIAVFASLSTEMKQATLIIGALTGAYVLARMALLSFNAAALVTAGGGLKAAAASALAFLKSITISPVLIWTAAIAATAVVFFKLGQSIVGARADYDRLTESMKKQKEFSDSSVKGFSDATSEILSGLSEITDTKEKKIVVTTALETANRDVRQLQQNLESAQRQAEEIAPTFKSLWQSGRAEWNLAVEGVKDYEKRLGAAKERQEALTKEMSKLGSRKMTEAMLREVKNLNTSLEQQAATFGMTALEIELYKFKIKGATEAHLAHTRALGRDLELKQLEKELATFGMDDEARLIYEQAEARKRDAGAIEEQRAGLQALKEQLEEVKRVGHSGEGEQKKQTEEVKALEKQYKELFETVSKGEKGLKDIDAKRLELKGLKENAKELEQFKKLMDEGKSVVESVMTPLEKYNERIKYLTKLHEGDAIGQEHFNRAVAQAQKELDDATKSTAALRQELQAIQGAAVGSAEAITRINAFTDRMKSSQKELRDALRAGRGADPIKLPDIKGGKMPDVKAPDVKGGGKMPDMNPIKVTAEITKLTLAADLPALKLAAEIDRLTLAAEAPILKIKAEAEWVLPKQPEAKGGEAPPIREDAKNPGGNPLPPGMGKGKTDELLTQIRDHLEAIRNKRGDGPQIKPANL